MNLTPAEIRARYCEIINSTSDKLIADHFEQYPNDATLYGQRFIPDTDPLVLEMWAYVNKLAEVTMGTRP